MTGDVFDLSDRLVGDLVALSPIEATHIGVDGFDHLWDDLSPEGIETRRFVFDRYRQAFASLVVSQDRWERLATRVGREYVEEHLDAIANEDDLCDLNTVASPLQNIRQVFDHMDSSTVAGWENIATRMETLHEVMGGYQRTLQAGQRKGLQAARRQVLAGRVEAGINAGDGSFFASVPDRFRAWGGADSGALEARIEAASRSARESFAKLGEFLELGYLPGAPVEDGVGIDRYLRHARKFLGMAIDPDEIYEWGWTQVAALHRRMVVIADQVDSSASLAQVIRMLKTDPARCASSQAQFVEIMKHRQEAALAALDGTHFDIPEPAKRLNVKIAPPSGSLGAYYVQPSEDFSRPGAVWYSLGDQSRIALWDEVSTAYHEGFPGHHLQCAVQLSLAHRLSRLHRLLVWHPGYGEGWALYTELLMKEFGYLEKPEYELGMLSAEMLRACRVVIDIGLHLGYLIPRNAVFRPGEAWTFETAVEMLTDMAFLNGDYAISEVTRYLGWPGQAISYKVGQKVILDLRDEMRARAGQAFDLKEFHSRVLGSGPVGLAHLRELVLEE
ncbi:MAG: DUF885 domain-containing protein [Acidimicrobiia bacterium]|nr:DUF885 domain-containing protein [Acidimicrobiia bacterium]